MRTCALVFLGVLVAGSAAWGFLPMPVFPGAGINVPFHTTTAPDGHGVTVAEYGWSFDGSSGRTGNGLARYKTTLLDNPTPTAMDPNDDWILQISYKHTGLRASDTPWFIRNDDDDVSMLSLLCEGTADSWSLRAAGTSGFETVVSGLSLGDDFHTFLIHYQAETQSLDAYLNGDLIAEDFTFGHGRYDVNFIQLEDTGAGTDWFANIKLGQVRAGDFGNNWLYTHPLTLSGLALRDNSLVDSRYRDCNFNMVMCWENNVGLMDKAHERQHLPWHWHTGPYPLEEVQDDLTTYITERPGAEGILVWDEPMQTEFVELARVADWVRGRWPELLVYSNLFPIAKPGNNYGKYYGMPWIGPGTYQDPPVPYDYDLYLSDFIEVVRPDVLMIDIYPWMQPPEGTAEEFLHERYYRNHEAVRRAGLRYDIPYWVYVQSYEREGGGAHRFPSESDLRMQVYSSIAYGFTGIGYFTFDHAFLRGLLEWGDATETWYLSTPLYYVAQEVNAELAHLGQSLTVLESTQVRFLRGRWINPDTQQEETAPAPLGVTLWNSLADDPYITDISVSNLGVVNDGLAGPVLIGHFTPALEELDGPAYENEIYIMVVNLLQAEAMSSEATRQEITLSFDFGGAGISQLKRLNRTSGEIEVIPLVHDGGSQYHVTLSLGGGNGDLFKYDTGAPFVNSTGNTCGSLEYPVPMGDVTGDCHVDLFDLQVIMNQWMTCTAPNCD